MTEKRRHLIPMYGCATIEYHGIWAKVCTLNPSLLPKARGTHPYLKYGRIGDCASEKEMANLSKQFSIGRILPTACNKHEKGAKWSLKSHHCVYSTDQGWPKSREGYGYGVLVVVKLVNGQITAKGDRSFYLGQKGGTADA